MGDENLPAMNVDWSTQEGRNARKERTKVSSTQPQPILPTLAGNWWVLLLRGIAAVLFGLAVLFWPGISALVLLYVISFWAILTGLLRVVMAIWLRREIENEWLMILSGVLSVLFGVVLGALPGVGLLSLVWLVGIYALIFGVALIAFSLMVR